ncbi:Hermansky-Pudlak syndrome 1 protein [Coregonus clupeaformis]|uniref:Hermansky-Pudlak syndrome 1 protein n=1 Tax=Coregonus clupeaformis TaxID=59861 RepID=UPI001E1C7B54|nr:Hermansky-Pudlak syndrome 1 protein [Coregonus clupeaformis]
MKCLLIASESAEVLFYWTDPEFELNIQEQYGASQEEGEKPPAFEDSINTLFAPIIISCSTMVDRLGDSYTSFSTENNHTYVLHQFEECLYIAVNGDREEGEEDLKRKIYVMKKMIEVLFGMVTLSSTLIRKELRPQDTEQRTRLWKHLQSLLETYSRLREQDQSFLVEAVERLIHPTLCEQCIEFLERRLVQQINSSVERAGEEVLHAFILVHTKLLAFYSSRNASTLTSSDLLALIVMVQNMYPSNIDLEDTAPEDVENTSAPDIFYTPEPSPTNKDSGTDRDSVNSGRYEESRHEGSSIMESGTPVFEFLDPDIQMAEDSLRTLEAPPPDPSTPSRVFLEVTLKEGCYPMMPHSMYCLPLWPGITLVLLTKIPNSNLAMSVYVFLEAFVKLEKRLSEGLEGSAARGQTSIQDLRNKLDKFIRALGTSDIQTSQLQSVWTEFKSRAFTRGGPGFSRDLVPWCHTMKSQLCGVYRQCFITENTVGGGSPQRLSPSLQDRALTMVQEKLMDWKDFLLVKSKRNITMVSYLEEFPGLIHFIYVDRTAGQMIAPSLNITDRTTSELGKGPLAHFIKGKVWGLVNTSRLYLQKGYSTVTLRDGDYFFCYFLWFENETGYKLEVKDLPILPDDSAPIGMLAWDYYRKLLRYYSKSHQGEVVKCYELLTVHLGVIPTEYILQHCSQLARKLWEPSRIPLL